MYEQLLNLDPVKINFSRGGMDLINIVLAFVMYGVALGIKPSMFKEVFKKPKSVILGFVCQTILLPALTFCLVIAFNNMITPMVAMGMILVAACPGGNISNFMTQLSKGNSELSVTLTAISTSISPITTPTNFALWGGLYVKYLNNHASNALQVLHIDIFDVFTTVFILLGIPLALGLLTSHYFPKFAEKLKKPMQIFSILFFIAMVVLSFSNNLQLFLKYIWYVFFIVLIHNALALLTGFGTASIFKLSYKDKKTLTIETGIQNSGLGLVLLFNPKIFPPDLMNGGMLFITAWWGIWHIISGLIVSTIFSHSKKTKNEAVAQC
ncbi:MAG: bile acid:sodium symporter family protein [Bacteroidales bacterium]|nr:bile acid:sodium symporter family protein [Bacteroidales bacterium]MDD4669411.1 bile acid:sodium symporter family protein [Bacteroidales bacterium]